jgi:hypothetical protein
MAYYKGYEWHPSLIDHAKGALQQATEVYGVV